MLKAEFLEMEKIIIAYDPKKMPVEKNLEKITENKISIYDISTTQPDLEEVLNI